MMKTHSLVTVALSAVALATGAQAANVFVQFPSALSAYSTAIGGSGVIGLSGSSPYARTAGDNFSETFSGTGLASVTDFSDSFFIRNFIGSADAVVRVSINDVSIGAFTAVHCNFCGSDQPLSFNASFAAIAPVLGHYNLNYTLTNTIADGDGSISFFTNNEGFLGGSNVSAAPEPISWAMMLTGFGLAGVALRRRRVAFAR